MGRQPIQQNHGIVSPCDSCHDHHWTNRGVRTCVLMTERTGAPRLQVALQEFSTILAKGVPTCCATSAAAGWASSPSGDGRGASLSKRRSRRPRHLFLGQEKPSFLDDKGICITCPKTGWPSGCCRLRSPDGTVLGGSVETEIAGCWWPLSPWGRGTGDGERGAGLVKLDLCLGTGTPFRWAVGMKGVHPSLKEMPMDIRNNVHHLLPA
jgi:hypothetical protein